jgi:hypothetical protein
VKDLAWMHALGIDDQATFPWHSWKSRL